jgi:class 3 adenylate cyclase
MADRGVERRLAAILAADVVGYSRLMAADEAGTYARLKALRKEVVEPKIAEHRGRVVKLTGDGALVEFPSVVDAVACAVEVQRSMAEHNAEVAPENQITFRVGVNLGDVIFDDHDIYGDGVNVAARLEGLAEPGGVCISAKVHEEVKNKLGFGYQDLGPQPVKNIPEPIRAYRVLATGAVVGQPTAGINGKRPAAWRMPTAAAVALVAIGAGILGWLKPWQSASEMAGATLDTRRVAVLPFTNISADTADEYFSDGMTEELISQLSKIGRLSVIARTSGQC